jgi:N-acylneuraminate cytidylyltransferase
MSYKYVCFIFARGGSKGLPNKNIRMLGDKPLIAHSIEVAKKIDRIDRIIVSTDSKEIADVAQAHGAEVPFMRPTELSQDDSSEWLAWRHGLQYLLDSTGHLPEAFVSLPTTAPLRAQADVENCIDEFERNTPDVVITVSQAHRNPYFNMVVSDNNGDVGLAIKQNDAIQNRQLAPKVYDMTTVCYVAKSEFVMSSSSIFDGVVRKVEIPLERSIDIDTILDFEIAGFLYNKKLESK